MPTNQPDYDALAQVLAAIEAHPDTFNMNHFFVSIHADGYAKKHNPNLRTCDFPPPQEGCGTACCIAGWTVALLDQEAWEDGLTSNDLEETASALLNLNRDQMYQLFWGFSHSESKALAYLRKLVRERSWSDPCTTIDTDEE